MYITKFIDTYRGKQNKLILSLEIIQMFIETAVDALIDMLIG